MKEIKIHANENGNLLSIKPLDNTYSDRNYLTCVIEKVFSITKGGWHLQASRPNYEYATTDLHALLRSSFINNYNLNFTDFEIIICDTKISEDLLKIFQLIWFNYEHVAFCFFIESKNEFDVKRKPWYEITMNSKSFVLFKGVEDDVLWIGKSSELSFDV